MARFRGTVEGGSKAGAVAATMKRRFDYTHQAWTVDGRYVDCGHPAAGTVMGADSPAPGEPFQGCNCYGRAHAGEMVSAGVRLI
jgi:hypothetical protein